MTGNPGSQPSQSTQSPPGEQQNPFMSGSSGSRPSGGFDLAVHNICLPSQQRSGPRTGSLDYGCASTRLFDHLLAREYSRDHPDTDVSDDIKNLPVGASDPSAQTVQEGLSSSSGGPGDKLAGQTVKAAFESLQSNAVGNSNSSEVDIGDIKPKPAQIRDALETPFDQRTRQ